MSGQKRFLLPTSYGEAGVLRELVSALASLCAAAMILCDIAGKMRLWKGSTASQ
jgi:hypothetical protein